MNGEYHKFVIKILTKKHQDIAKENLIKYLASNSNNVNMSAVNKLMEEIK